jgi:hypothetical protein
MINFITPMDYKLLSSGLVIVISILMITVERPSLAQQESNSTTITITNSNTTTTNFNTNTPAINQTELDEWFNSLPDGTYGTIVDSHNFNSSNYPGEDYGNSVDENGTLNFAYPNV